MSTVDPGSPPPSGGDGGPPADDLSPPIRAAARRSCACCWAPSCAGCERRPESPRNEAGYEIRASRSKISRLEHGRVSFKPRDVADLLTLYGVTNEQTRAGLLSLAEQANAQGWWAKYSDILPDWFEAYLGLEAAASLIRSFELQFVHGLFQTQGYARAVTVLGHKAAPAEEIDRRVSLRMKRQDLLHSPDAPRVWSVMDEAALRRPVGGAQVMRGQLDRLIEWPRCLRSRSRSCRSGGAGTRALAAHSRYCGSARPTCRTWPISSSSPAPSTWKGATTSITIWKS